MSGVRTDSVFAGSVPALYESYLVPLIFEPYAEDLARRVAARGAASVLEIAAGTGVLTRRLAELLPASTRIVATDLNQPMLDQASALGTRRAVEWQQADALSLPFEAAGFDIVACQFGAMFFPDKARAYAEARRVLRPGGAFMFSVWDLLEANDFAEAVTTALAARFPDDPPRFLARTPHGYHDPVAIALHLRDGGFGNAPQVATVAARSRAPSARHVAVAYCEGTPLRDEIEARSPGGLGAATDIVEHAIRRRFGAGPVEAMIRAHVITAMT